MLDNLGIHPHTHTDIYIYIYILILFKRGKGQSYGVFSIFNSNGGQKSELTENA
jgi:hypothetical protein